LKYSGGGRPLLLASSCAAFSAALKPARAERKPVMMSSSSNGCHGTRTPSRRATLAAASPSRINARSVAWSMTAAGFAAFFFANSASRFW
jgi:hypothetical protein